jgi:polysaccharide biosynthesis transport protein
MPFASPFDIEGAANKELLMIANKPTTDKSLPSPEEALIPADYLHASLDTTGGRYYPSEYGEMDRLQLSEFWRRIRKHQWLIAAIVLIVTAVVTIEAYRTKSIYRASATLQLELENRMLLRTGDISIESEEAENSFVTSAAMKTKIRLLQNRPLLEDVVSSLRLDQNPNFLDVTQRKNVWESLKTITEKFRPSQTDASSPLYIEPPPSPDPEKLPTRSSQESARLSPFVAILSSNLKAAQVEDTRLLVISYDHTNPTLAAQIVNTTAEYFVAHNYRNKTRRFNTTSSWLNARTRDLKDKLEMAEQKLADFSGSNGLFSPNGNESLVVEKLGKLHAQVTQAETERILKQSLYEEVQQGRLVQLPEAFADARLTALQTKLNELYITASQYAGRFGPDNPRTQDVQKQIAALLRQLEEGRKTLADKLKADYERASRDEQSLRLALQQANAEAVQQNQASVQFGLLQQEVQTAKTLYTEFLQKTNQVAIQRNEQHNNLQVIEQATLPVEPIGPHRWRTILIGILLSLCFGVGLALAIEYFDDTIKTTDDIMRYIRVPTLAVVPTALSHRMRLATNSRKAEESKEQSLLRPLISQSENLRNKSASMLTEAYRGLRTSLLLSAAGTPPKTILFTSSQPSEGKTTTTINTAISLAQLGLSVVIIDADLRRPSVHKVFGMTPSQGISNYLSHHMPLAPLLQPCSIPCVSVLPCGSIPPNPTELLSSEKMRTMVQLLKEHFDHVLIDSPPLTNFADSLVLSTLADGVILVVQSGQSRRRVVQRVRRDLMRVGAKIFGVVLNKVDNKSNGYEDYHYYSKYYSYAQSE